MTRGMLRRVERLEERSEAAHQWPLTIICQRADESDTEAIARHGLVPGEHRLVILRRYGAAACWCHQRGEGA